MMWTPSPLTGTLVPEWAAPPSSDHVVAATPDAASDGLSVTVTAPLCQPAGALSLVAGAAVSTRTTAVRVGSATSP